MLFIFAIAGMSFRLVIICIVKGYFQLFYNFTFIISNKSNILLYRPLARIISRGVLAMLTLCGTLQGPSQNISTSSTINLNTSLVEGKYNYHSSENFDAYLKELGVSWYLRDLASIAAPIVSISRMI